MASLSILLSKWPFVRRIRERPEYLPLRTVPLCWRWF
jgi:hypothetical protein